jgi:hypothetical protein
MNFATWFVAPAVIVVVLVLLVITLIQRRRRRQLLDLFGPDFSQRLGPREPGSDLDGGHARQSELAGLHLRPLTPAERQSYRADWQRVQSSFVDRPALAVHEADALLTAVFRARGFPVETFEEATSRAPAEFAATVQRYQAAQTVHLRADSSETTTDELRAAFVLYRELFDELTTEAPVREPHQSERVHP